MNAKRSNNALKQLISLDKAAYKKHLQEEAFEPMYTVYMPLHKHVLFGKISRLQEYIAAGYDINTPDIWGRTAIYYAIFNDDISVFKFLVENGADYNFKDLIDGSSLLHLAATEGHLDKVKYMVEELGLSIDDLDDDYKTPLSSSMLFSQVDIAEYLIEQGAINDCRMENIDVLMKHLTDVLKKMQQKSQKLTIIPFNMLNKINRISQFLATV